MKNISRRVFIKGMAVAAVATAASTVLAGCNVPGTTTEAPVVGFQGQTQTMVLDADKEYELTLSTTSLAVTMDKQIKVGLKLVNNTDKTIFFNNTDPCVTACNNVNVAVYFDNELYVNGLVAQTASYEKNMIYAGSTYGKGGFAKNEDGKSFIHEGYLYFDGAKAPKDWKKMTLVATVKKYTDSNSKEVNKELIYTLNK